MTNPTFQGLVDNVRSDLSTDSFSASSSLATNPYTDDPFLSALRGVGEDISNSSSTLEDYAKSAYVGAARFAGSVISAPFDQSAGLSSLPPTVVDAYNTMRDPNADPFKRAAAQEVLNQQSEIAMDGSRYGSTWDEKIQNRIKSQEIANDITEFFDVSHVLNQRDRNELNKDLGDSFAKIDEAWKNDDIGALAATATTLGETIKVLLDNPKAIGEYVVENLPSLGAGVLPKIGKTLMAADQTGYVSSIFNERIQKYQDKNNGQLPSSEQMQKEIAFAASAGLAEKVGDTRLLKAITDGGSLKKLAGDVVTEGAGEAYQSLVEEGLAEGNVDLEAAYKGGVIGGASGGAIASVGPAISTAAKGTKAVLGAVSKGLSEASVVVKNKEFIRKKKETEEAIKTGDISKIIDEESPDFDLAQSVDILAKDSKRNAVTPEEKQMNFDIANTQISNQETKMTEALNEYESLLSKEEPTAEDKKKLYELDKTISSLDKSITSAKSSLNQMKPDVAKTSNVQEDIKAATSGNTEAAKRTFGSFRRSPDFLTGEQAEELANADNGLTPQEKKELKTYAAIEQSLRTAQGVRSNIIQGGYDKDTGRPMLGIKDYQRDIFSGDDKRRNTAMQGLSAFAQRQLDKVTRMEQALKDYEATGKVQKVETGFGKTYSVHKGSVKNIAEMRAEANLLNDTVKKFSGMVRTAKTESVIPTNEREQPTTEPTGYTQEESPVNTEQVPLDAYEERMEEDTDVVSEPTLSQQPEVVSEVAPSTTIEQVLPYQVEGYSLAKELTSKEDNKVSDWFRGSNSTKVLNSINDFMVRFKADPMSLLNGSVKDPSRAKPVADSFIKFHDNFVNSLDGVFKTKEFKDRDLVQYLVDENGNLPDNVKTAMAVGAYEWIISNGKDNQFNTPDSIRSLLGMKDEDPVPAGLYDLIPEGTNRASVINSMGTSALKGLNLKMEGSAPRDAQTKLETAMGSWMFVAMQDAGVLQTQPKQMLSKDIYQYLRPRYEKEPKWLSNLGSANTMTPRIIVNLDLLGDMFEVNSQYSTFTGEMFGVTTERPMPSFTPIKEAVKKVSKSDQKVPEAQRAVLAKDQEKPYTFKAETAERFFDIPREIQEVMMGVVDTTHTLKENLKAVEAKNKSIQRELDTAQEMYDSVMDQPDGIKSPFYFMHTVWRQGRMGLANRFNPQSSKIHRYLVERPAWKTTVKMTDAKAIDWFMLTVGEGFDIEVAKEGSANAAKAFEKLREENPVIDEAIAQIKAGNISDYSSIVKAVKLGKGKMKTYQSLVALAEFELAVERDDAEFTHALARETDGITNGVCITSVQFAEDDMKNNFRRLNRMGIYEEQVSYNDWANTPGNQDSYKTIARDWEKGILNLLAAKPHLQKTYKEVSKIFGSFMKLNEETGEMEVTGDGRKIAKSPLMTSIYGAGMESIISNIGDQAIDIIYDRIGKAYEAYMLDQSPENKAKLSKVVKDDFDMIEKISGQRPAKFTSIEDIKNFKLNARQVKAIKKATKDIYLEPMQEAMKVDFGVSYETRDKLNAVVNLSHAMFMQMYQHEEQLMLEANGVDVLTNDMEKELFAKMKKIFPMVNTAISKIGSRNSNQALQDSGLMLTNYEPKPQRDTKGNLVQNVEISPAKNIEGFNKGKFTKVKSLKSTGMLKEMTDPGVGAVPMITQSIDAAVQLFAMGRSPILNVHDASYFSYNNNASDKQSYNGGFETINRNFSIAGEVAQMYQRIHTAYEGYGFDYAGISQQLENASTAFMGKDGKLVSATTIGEMLNSTAATHDANKGKVFDKAGNVEQYSSGEDSGKRKTPKFGSTQQTEMDEFDYEPARVINEMNSEQVFEELQKISEVKDSKDHFEHLRSVITNVANQVITPFNLHLANSKATQTIGSTDGTDMYIVNQIEGTPLSPDMVKGLPMSSSEVFVHELVHNISQFGIENMPGARAALNKLWVQAKRQVTVESLMDDPTLPKDSPEYLRAEQTWKHIFEPTTVQLDSKGRRVSNHLHEFVALGMTNQKFMKALAQVDTSNQTTIDSDYAMGRLAQLIASWFDKVMDYISSAILGTRGLTADKKLEQLFRVFSNTDTSTKAQLVRKAERTVNTITTPVNNFIGLVQPKAQKVILEPVSRFSDIALNKITEEIRAGRLKTPTILAKESYEILANSSNALAELAMSMVTEARGRFDKVGVLHDMKRFANMNIDQFRNHTKASYKTFIKESFSTKLSSEDRVALSKAIIKTDIVALLEHFNMEEIKTFLSDPEALDNAIAEYTERVGSVKDYGSQYLRQTKNLANYMVTGNSKIANGMLNAKNIAEAVGTGRRPPSFANEMVPLIDTLASLMALQQTSKGYKAKIKKLVDIENSRTDGNNGIDTLINTMKEYKRLSDIEFKDNDRHLAKGYMADKVNPNIDIKVGTLADRAKMEAEGYTFDPEMKLSKDRFDSDRTTKYMYVNRHGGTPPHIGGLAYSKTDTKRGTSLVMDPTIVNPEHEVNDLGSLTRKAIGNAQVNWNNTELDDGNYSIPVVNQNGEIVDYRYVMSEATKDDLLDRITDVDEVLGMMFSNMVVKERIRNQNKTLVTELLKMYQEEDDTSMYVEISNESSDPRLREHYRLMTPEMKGAIREQWGMDKMYVRKDAVDLIFGYHKFTLANLWKMEPEDRKYYQKFFVTALNWIFGPMGGKAAVRVAQGEELVQALAKTVKDIIVIKSGMTTLGNMLSNVVLLSMKGVSMKDIFNGHIESFRGMRDYKRTNAKLEQVKLKLQSAKLSPMQRKNLETELVRLESELSSNPVVNLVDQGLLSTIVEDVDTEAMEYRLRDRIRRKGREAGWEDHLDNAVNQLPKGVRTVAKEALVLQGSNLYDFLSEAAQFSDFGARYVLYKQLTEKGDYKGNKLDPDVAAGKVMDVFINYDLPTHRGLQYLNDLGLIMFSKYLIRVQKIILQTFKENPARTLGWLLFQNYFGDVSDISDSMIGVTTDPLSRIANPVTAFMDASDEIITLRPFI